MKFAFAIVASVCLTIPALAQAPAAGTPPKPPTAQHQPGTPAPVHPPSQAAAPKTAPTEKAGSSDKVDPAKEAAIRHLMEITQTSKLGDNIATYLSGQVRSGVSHGIAPDALPKFMDAFNQKFAATGASSAVTNAMVPIYARAFSMEDIQGLIQFYESPLGQRVVKGLPDVVQESQVTGVQLEQSAALNVLKGMSDQYPELKQILPADNAQPGPGVDAAPSKTPVPGPAPAPEPKPTPATPKP
jgi:hypothetical protein